MSTGTYTNSISPPSNKSVQRRDSVIFFSQLHDIWAEISTTLDFYFPFWVAK